MQILLKAQMPLVKTEIRHSFDMNHANGPSTLNLENEKVANVTPCREEPDRDEDTPSSHNDKIRLNNPVYDKDSECKLCDI